ncbi:hypothetical protein [Rubellimicrobium roseum]|uniref:Uncharacterized protein n=1 Tax=Rubellimicrobium roseum TaxID=687525 RepID=A0A5C4NHL0_9RHOB|nr:hypothetical protein [Rubellimicrobium roseum]TNC74103.1 hypothetical protein FHG71_02575 [Rubellimicrobium roseum]
MAAHLLMALAGGIAAAAMAVMAGLPLWAAALLYVVGGQLGLIASVAVSLLRPEAEERAIPALAAPAALR